ncbi:MAG: hypothetical protein LKF75_02080 [Bacilli bacterium]|jgi:hypothetical protein|nr:hypothetical protein [Bacilli bacterium]MCH4211055.1 hypothetical protein [Bacilli bacterium]MCH4228478.1 hypothetical protein [Bacilli bacterium]MCH4277586.1 hypothetical protein [Bacilli bacterium]MCI2054925.1 hypothetical protein [Bacilli bacterium]
MKPEKDNKHTVQRENRTGEDIDMLRERESDPQSGEYGSDSYKDNYDAA